MEEQVIRTWFRNPARTRSTAAFSNSFATRPSMHETILIAPRPSVTDAFLRLREMNLGSQPADRSKSQVFTTDTGVPSSSVNIRVSAKCLEQRRCCRFLLPQNGRESTRPH